jgi:hypothetical protein
VWEVRRLDPVVIALLRVCVVRTSSGERGDGYLDGGAQYENAAYLELLRRLLRPC